jgi:hypothetical protein
MKIPIKKRKYSKKDIERLIRCVQQLALEIPPNASDPQWGNIDRFLNKPGKLKKENNLQSF